MNEIWPHYDEYQTKTEREIPVVVLERDLRPTVAPRPWLRARGPGRGHRRRHRGRLEHRAARPDRDAALARLRRQPATVGLFVTVQFVVHMLMQIPGGRAADRWGARDERARRARARRARQRGLRCRRREPALALPRPRDRRHRHGLRVRRRQRLHPRARRLAVPPGRLRRRLGARAGHRRRGRAAARRAGSAGARRICSAIVVARSARRCSRSRPPRRARCATPASGSSRGFFRDRRLYRLAAIHAMSFGFSVIVGNWVVTLLEHHGHSKRVAPRSPAR